MKKFVINLTGLYIEINSKYDYTFDKCKDFIVDEYDRIDLRVECQKDDFVLIDDSLKEDYQEYLAINRIISSQLFNFNRILVHGAAISYNDKGFLFMAESGVGKSTHIKLLRDNYDGVDIINGDKPIIDTNGYIYGTPWAGKENWTKNVSYKLSSIVFLYRGNTNLVKKINSSDSITKLLNGSFVENGIDKAVDILNTALKDVSFFELYCTKSLEAANVSFNNILNTK